MRPVAIAKRRFQFVAGPESHEFYACSDCHADLDKPWVMNELFYASDRWPIEPVDPDDEERCDMCREG
jgi:hypothetical protein